MLPNHCRLPNARMRTTAEDTPHPCGHAQKRTVQSRVAFSLAGGSSSLQVWFSHASVLPDHCGAYCTLLTCSRTLPQQMSAGSACVGSRSAAASRCLPAFLLYATAACALSHCCTLKCSVHHTLTTSPCHCHMPLPQVGQCVQIATSAI